MRHAKVIQNQKHLALEVVDQSFQELDQKFAIHALLMQHEPDFALVGDSRDHFRAHPFGR
jgi:hypothetical protein